MVFKGKEINNKVSSCIIAFITIISIICFNACSSQDEPDPGVIDNTDPQSPDFIATSILIYAVASNNLSFDFSNDMTEVLEAAKSIDFKKVDVWVYSLTHKQSPTLRRVTKSENSEDYVLSVVKDYDRLTYSTDPKRISEVISDYLSLTKADKRGLILWSHATGWSPKFSDHALPEVKEADASVYENNSAQILRSPAITGKVFEDTKGWYGQDTYEGKADYCDLLELDNAIPASTFDFIWFDCCYMSNIEVLYQLRDKASYIVAYPTEMAAEGLPYHITLPYIASPEIDLTGAARATTDYFLAKNGVITICVTKTDNLPQLAKEASKAVNGTLPSPSILQKYSRLPSGPFYDFGQYTSLMGESLDEGWNRQNFESALEQTVLYKAASARGFDNRSILPENFSGISCHYFDGEENDENTYYKSLDWFNDVYKNY